MENYISDRLYKLDEKDIESIDKHLIEYIKYFNNKVDELLKDIEYGNEKYDGILNLRYKTKILKGIDPEFLIELRHGNHIYDLKNRDSRLSFYKNNKEWFKEVEAKLKSV